MSTHSIPWAEIQVGDPIQTPFGVAEVLAIDTMRLRLQTELGLWDLSEVEPRTAPEDLAPESVVEFLTGPMFEVRTVHDFLVLACDCDCNACTRQVVVHKVTKRRVMRQHTRGYGCNCDTECWCTGSLEEA